MFKINQKSSVKKQNLCLKMYVKQTQICVMLLSTNLQNFNNKLKNQKVLLQTDNKLQSVSNTQPLLMVWYNKNAELQDSPTVSYSQEQSFKRKLDRYLLLGRPRMRYLVLNKSRTIINTCTTLPMKCLLRTSRMRPARLINPIGWLPD